MLYKEARTSYAAASAWMPEGYAELAYVQEISAAVEAEKEQVKREKEEQQLGIKTILVTAPIHDPQPISKDPSPFLRVRSTHQFPPDHESFKGNKYTGAV